MNSPGPGVHLGYMRDKHCRLVTCALASSLVFLIFSVLPAFSAELRLAIKGIRSDRGEILIGLYDNPNGFRSAIANASKRGLAPDRNRLVGIAIRAKRGTVTTVFTQLPPGRYAIIVIHDANNNGRLDENFLGFPTEGYGFSNNARSFLSSPSFDAAAITMGSADANTSITLIYPNTLLGRALN